MPPAVTHQPITHEQLRQAVRDCAARLGWRVLTTYHSQASVPGEPDLRLIHRGQRRLIWAELKTGSGRLTADQKQVIDDLLAAGQRVYIWREEHWLSGEVEAILRGLRPGEEG
jgi:hypothetical protein